MLPAILGIPASFACLFQARTRQIALFILLLSILFVACGIGGIQLGNRVRMAGMRSFAGRSAPLIAAINSYERDHSSPPTTLNDLVPTYLPAVPSTGMMAYPEYRYETGDDVKRDYAGNLWVLSVFTPSGGINFDMIALSSSELSGSRLWWILEHLGDWAYVHE